MKIHQVWCAVFLMLLSSVSFAQERAYKAGAVTVVTSVKVMDGQSDNYMKFLASTWRRSMEASKAAGIVVDYAVYNASPRRADDADLYLVTTYPNMASFDGLTEKLDAIATKTMKMNLAQREEAAGKRTVMRTILGTEMLRAVEFK